MSIEPFREFMNAPERPTAEGYIGRDRKTNEPCVCCPHCGAKNFVIRKSTVIRNLPWRCKSSKCRKEFEVNV